MMTKEEFIEKLDGFEWEDFEVKEAKGEVPKSSWETVSAFSNSSGGWLIFGVKEIGKKFEVKGVNNPAKIEQDFLGTLRGGQKFNTVINPVCEKYRIDEKDVLAFYIAPSGNKPIYYNTQSNTFIRRGSADQKATAEEIDAMYRDQTYGSKSNEFAEGTSIKDLKEKSIKEYRTYMAQFNPGASYNRMELDEFLVKLRVLDKKTKQCTNSGLLFFGLRDSVEEFFPDFRIDLFEIPGATVEEASSRYSFRLGEDDYENLWEAYFECFQRLRKEVDVSFKMSVEGFGEELSPGLNAVRETLVNMLMHADYFAPSHPRVRIFSNSIEFYNPGGLPKKIEELKEKDLSIPRNPVLAKLFRMVKLAENAGFGFDKIDDNWKEYNNTEPVYDLSFDSTIVKLTTKLKESHSDTENVGTVSEESRNDVETMSERILNELGSLRSRLSISPEDSLEFLQGNYGAITGYLRGKYGVNKGYFDEGNKERELFILILIDAYPQITKEQIAKILGVSLSTIEKSMRELRKYIPIQLKGAPKTGKWVIKKRNNNGKD